MPKTKERDPVRKTHRVVVGIVMRRYEVLMICRSRPEGSLRWHFPSGTVEADELGRRAVVREVFEETGIHCTVRKPLGGRQHPQTGANVTYWLCQWKSGSGEVREPDKASEVRWVSPGEAAALITSDLDPEVRLQLQELEAQARIASARSPVKKTRKVAVKR